MRYSQLKAFHHVALEGGFTTAAEKLHLTQPAVSEQVRNLEKTYDVQLFSRDRKKVALTSAGKSLLHLTRQLFEVEDQIEEALSESSTGIAGELRIVADSAHHVSDLLAAFNRKFPNVTISVLAGNYEEVLSRLRNYDAEIGVAGSVAPGRDMETISLGFTEIIAFCARDFDLANRTSLRIEDLPNLPLVFRESGSKTRRKLEDEAQKRGITLKPTFVAEGREAVSAIVAAGAGVGFVSEAEFDEESQLRKVRLDDVHIGITESIVYLSQRRDVRLIRAFTDMALGPDSSARTISKQA